MAQAPRKTNGFVIGISIAVVVVLVGLGALVVWMNSRATDAGPAPSSDILDAETGAITYGDGEDTVAVYIDFMCPICNDFERSYGEALQKAAEDGKITLEYHPISILDRFSTGGTEYSSRSANATFCVAENAPDKALDYMGALFENQPQENTPGLSDDELVALAEGVGADAAASCITDGTYKKWGAAQAAKHEIQGTPTVDINGERLDFQKGELQQMIDLIS